MKKGVKKTRKKRRSQIENPGLKPQYNSKIRQEYLDYDYLDSLTEEEKAWLSNFTEEYLGANFDHKGKPLYDKRMKKKRRQLYHENNARNRCVYGQAKAKRAIRDFEQKDIIDLIESRQDNGVNEMEDALIDFIDAKESDKSNK